MVKFLLKKHTETFDSVALILGRIGFCSRGFIWASVGIIAVVAAFTGNDTQGTQGALILIARHNGGIAFFILITLGIFCYSSWRFFEGAYGFRVDPKASKFQQIVGGVITPFASGCAYLIFAASNINTIREGLKNSNSDIIGTIASDVVGKIFLVIISFFVFVTSIMWIVDLYKRKFMKDLDQKALNKVVPLKVLTITFAYLGTFGRAILFALLGVEILRVCFDSRLTGGGFGVALQQLQYDTTARIFLVFFGFLVFLFGCFSVCQAFFKIFFPYHPRLLARHQLRSNQTGSLQKNFKSHVGHSATAKMQFEPEMDAEDRQANYQDIKKKMKILPEKEEPPKPVVNPAS